MVEDFIIISTNGCIKGILSMCKLFIIDEDLSQRAIICSAFEEKLNYKVNSFSSVMEAINYLKNNSTISPDIILFDISKITNYCKAIEDLKLISPNSIVIVLTKYGDYENAMIAVNAGANDFLTKPVSIERFSITFRNLLMLRNMQNTNNSNNPFQLLAEDGNVRMMSELEEDIISYAMQRYNGRMTEVARRLGIGRSTLYRKSEQMLTKTI